EGVDGVACPGLELALRGRRTLERGEGPIGARAFSALSGGGERAEQHDWNQTAHPASEGANTATIHGRNPGTLDGWRIPWSGTFGTPAGCCLPPKGLVWRTTRPIGQARSPK